jgi:NADPH2:quinone reductase
MTGIYVPVFFQKPELILRSLIFLADGVKHGTIKANVAAVLPLSKTADAHRMLEERRAQGVVVLDPKS